MTTSPKDLYDRLVSTHLNPGSSEEAISAHDDVRYVVVNENTLGLIRQGYPDQVEVLAGSVIKGGRDWRLGPFSIASSDLVRPATLADFKAFRVSPDGHLRNAKGDVESSGQEPVRRHVR